MSDIEKEYFEEFLRIIARLVDFIDTWAVFKVPEGKAGVMAQEYEKIKADIVALHDKLGAIGS